MNQIYNLLETIKEDKKAVAECEKQLHYLKGVLSAHESALERLTNVPEGDTTPVVRITRENWKSLGIEVGDKVKIIVSGDFDFEEGIYKVTDLEDEDYEGSEFMSLDEGWYSYNWNARFKDELYLIKGEK